MYDLKRNNQELEKFKFVLDYKIKELRKQIEPRENDIKEMREQIQEVSHTVTEQIEQVLQQAVTLWMESFSMPCRRSNGSKQMLVCCFTQYS